jgi:hypothetical protein
MSRWALVISVRCPECAGAAGEGADVDAVELTAQVRPRAIAGVLGDPGQQKSEPAQDDVGADALLLAVVGAGR